ncbi:MAG: Arc family DNA-binding protein [Propionibacteriaceae bacterium]|jgi:hypothetical protein|nr:Arc family DNA-binding protein [Propionibacteriaceae bacterium]
MSTPPTEGRSGRKSFVLRLDPAVHQALVEWAAADLRSLNSQIELLLRESLRKAGRLPTGLTPPRRPGRPPSS